MSKSASHIPRTLEWLRARGFLATKAEVWVPFVEVEKGVPHPYGGVYEGTGRKYLRGGTKRDLFGIADIVALPPAPRRVDALSASVGKVGTVYVQVLSVGALAAHLKTAMSVEDGAVLARMLATGNTVLMFCWRWVEKVHELCAACDGAGCSKCGKRGYKVSGRAGWRAEPREVVKDGSGYSVRPWVPVEREF